MMYQAISAESYDQLNADATDLKFYQQHIRPDETILEVMCGTGRLLIPMLYHGFNIEGIDWSEHMLNICYHKALSLTLSPVLFRGSLEIMDLGKKYDSIIIAGASIMLFQDIKMVANILAILKNHLNPGGRLFVDIFTKNGFQTEGRKVLLDYFQINVPDGIIKIYERNVPDEDESLSLHYRDFYKICDGKVVAFEEEVSPIRWYNPAEFMRMLSQAGFIKIEQYPYHYIFRDNIIFSGQNPEG